MPALCALLVLVGLVVAVPATWAARAIGRRLNALDAPGVAGQVKEAPRRVPNTGGIGIFLGVALPIVVVLAAVNSGLAVRFAADFPAIAEHLPGLAARSADAFVLLGSLFVLHAVGLLDDRRPLGPFSKLGAMVLVSAAAVYMTDTRLLTMLDTYPGGFGLSVALTVLWIIVITNAFNFLDNMDGLSAGVAAICASALLAAAIVAEQWFVGAALALLIGALLGFLIFNFPWRVGRGASVFMGDGGALVIGFLLAFLSVRITWVGTVSGPDGGVAAGVGAPAWGVLMPIIALAVPLYDFASVTIIRLAQGRSPFVGDLQHFSHRLVKHGLTRRAAVLVIYGCTAVTGIGAISLPKLAWWQAALVGVQTLIVLMVIALYEWARTPGANGDAR
ncbi:MAG: undecaprenyl/decaprenyl-phosphate alpha-N-acetylglucosaminyl 1-phosphate transferase [Phycisphaeraceae bacterium]|nr:undecaprenyl/decaprenyl-phosphate alpha-N-acetylglucosaminyl 1-phosphate transferase [Phycisphaeraceae bacterium]MBX3406808.1 undecaprenyl/decaprenyl-phosphate alpha-N-acetylglucosaminyl 1-phosphate transferase [Phycisphaeraceae bacterium]